MRRSNTHIVRCIENRPNGLASGPYRLRDTVPGSVPVAGEHFAALTFRPKVSLLHSMPTLTWGIEGIMNTQEEFGERSPARPCGEEHVCWP